MLIEKVSPLKSYKNNFFIYYSANIFAWVYSLKCVNQIKIEEISKKNLIESIKEFKENISKNNSHYYLNDMAIYFLCAFLDEKITIFQIKKHYDKFNAMELLKYFYNDSYGGNKFFIYLEKSINDIKNSIYLIEFIYMILCLGYKGKYFQDEKSLNKVKLKLFNKIYKKLISDSKERIIKKEKKYQLIKKNILLFMIIDICLFLILNLFAIKNEKVITNELKLIEKIYTSETIKNV